MTGTNTTDSEAKAQQPNTKKISTVIRNVGRAATGVALGLGMVAGSPSPAETQVRNDKPKQERVINKEGREGFIEVTSTSVSKGFGPDVDGKPQGPFFYTSGAPKPLPEGTDLGNGLMAYDQSQLTDSFGKGKNFMTDIWPEVDTEGIRYIRVRFDKASSGVFDPTKISVETRGGGVATITSLDFENIRRIDIIPNSPKGDTTNTSLIENDPNIIDARDSNPDLKDVERTVGTPVDYILVTLIDPKTGREIQWKTVLTEKQTPPDTN